ncbi:7TM diverse intracellular signaling domain-containing protein [Hahella sp. SMD15-11]|uniref:diguanylate cyclase n=1 Tax=Thermohahella caldifontis TaxID=3142973 RepID=A0AB39UVF6_9GAMM
MTSFLKVLTVLLLALGLNAQASQHREPALRLGNQQQVYVANQIWYTQASPDADQIDRILARDDLSWQKNRQDVLNFGLDNQPWWLKLRLYNTTGQPLQRLLEVAYPLLDHVDLYVVAEGQVVTVYRSGDALPFSHRPIRHRNFLFPFELKPDTDYTLYLRVQTEGSLQVPLMLWSPQAFFEADQVPLMLQSAFFGLLVIMAAYNFMLFLFLRDRAFLYYTLYIASIGLVQLDLHGFTRQFLWPEAAEWGQLAFVILASLATVFATTFSYRFLNFGIRPGIPGRLIQGGILLGLICLAVALFGSYHTAVMLILLAIFVASLIGIGVGGYQWLRGVQSARYFTLGWLVFLLGNILISLSKGGILPRLPEFEYAPQVGVALEALLFSIALAHRVQEEREQRLAMQKRLVQQERELREAQAATLRAREHYAREMEDRLELRSRQLQDAMSRLSNAQEKLRHIATLDPLTGLRNQSYFNDTLREEWNRCARAISPLSLILLDVDDFRDINQKHSALAGDELLRQIARVLETRVQRAGDSLFKLDGDRFALLLPHTPLEGAMQVAEELCDRIGHRVFDVEGERLHVTVSAGVSSELASQEPGWQQLVNAARDALSEAKDLGGSRAAFRL